MATAQTMKLFLILILPAAFLSRELVVSPDCTDSSTDPCTTLEQYVQSSANDSKSSIKLVLDAGEHYLDTDFIVENASDISIVAAETSNQSTINCEHNATFKFVNVTNVIIENIVFVSCGKSTSKGIPAITISGINGLTLSNIALSESVTGALYVTNSHDLTLNNFSLRENLNSANTIVEFELSEVNLTGTTTISNNRIGGSELQCEKNTENVIVRIKECSMSVGDLIVSDNISPNGVVNITYSELSVSGDWTFNRNSICKGGTLFLETVVTRQNGGVSFTNNSVSNSGVSGIVFRDSDYGVIGDMEFTANSGYLTALQSVNTNVTINGSLNIVSNINGARGVLISSRSTLNINGSLSIRNNSLRDHTLRADTDSTVTIEGETYCAWNKLYSPLAFFNAKVLLSGRVTFTNNAGVLFALLSHVTIAGISKFTNNSFENDFLDGALSIERSTLTISGDYLFEDNQANSKNGGGIFANIQCKVVLSGKGVFCGNSARYGGAIYLNQNSDIEIKPRTNLVFQQNEALKGGAIFISTPFSHVNCSSLPCLFLPDDSNATNTSLLTFFNNSAAPGGSILHVNIERLDFEMKEQTFPALENLQKLIKTPDNGNTEPKFFSDSFQLCFCKNDSLQNCESNRTTSIRTARGKPFSVMVRAPTFYGDSHDEPVRSNLVSALNYLGQSSLLAATLDGCFQIVHNKKCTELVFKVSSAQDKETVVINVGESFLEKDKTLYVNLEFEKSCPRGFALNKDNDTCVCDSRLTRYLFICDLAMETFQKWYNSSNFWIGPDPNTSNVLFYDECPHGYCIGFTNFSLTDNSTCENNRRGRLCGKCIEGYSLLIGGVKCKDCSNSNLALLLVFAALGILLVALIFLIQITVASGTVNALILYMDIVFVNRNLLLPPNFFPGYAVIIAWFNLNFGIETCFYNKMTQIQYAVWQFVFPVYLWVMVGGIIVACHYSIRVSKLFGSSDPVAVLATIMLLTYNSLVQNVIDIFTVAHISAPGDSTILVWRFNGEIDYGTGSHGALMLVALLFLVFLFTPFVLILTSAQLLQKYEFTSKILQRCRLIPFLSAYQVPFKPAHRYWVGLSLIFRSILLIIFASAEDEFASLLAIVIFCFLFVCTIGATGGVYSKHWLNVLEISFMLNLGILSASRLYFTLNNYYQAYISVTVALIGFVLIITFHTYRRLKKYSKAQGLLKKLKERLKKKEARRITEKVDKPEAVVRRVDKQYFVTLRESLLESQESS